MPTRRAVLAAAAAGLAAAGCTDDAPRARRSTGPSPSPSPSTRSSPTPSPDPLPSSAPWPLVSTEVEPRIKGRAVRIVEALAAWPRGQPGVDAAQERLAELGAPARLAGQAAAVLHEAPEASARVIAAQYGGLLAERASVLVAFHQWLRREDGSVTQGGSAADVRLARGADGWEVSAIYPARSGEPLDDPGGLIERVVAHRRVHLPPAAEADVLAGNLRPLPLRALLALAERYEVDVTIVHSAHPRNVFGTDRLSDHTRRRAFDVWAVNGKRVVDAATPDSLIDGFMRRAVAAGAYNVGGPRWLGGGSYFSDRVHRDHLHIAFNRDT